MPNRDVVLSQKGPIPWRKGKRMPFLHPLDYHTWREGEEYSWEKAVFTVPSDVTEERVQAKVATLYRNKFGEHLESLGFRVLGMVGPIRDKGLVAQHTVDQDRKRYILRAKVFRYPVPFHTEVPDSLVPAFTEDGFSLVS